MLLHRVAPSFQTPPRSSMHWLNPEGALREMARAVSENPDSDPVREWSI
jgi:hypothetical protein